MVCVRSAGHLHAPGIGGIDFHDACIQQQGIRHAARSHRQQRWQFREDSHTHRGWAWA